MKTFEEFVARIQKLEKEKPSQRVGQLIFNELAFYRPVLGDKLRGSSIDPFYKSSWEDCNKALDWIDGNFNHRCPATPT
jgi:hypothetical protein